MLIIIIIITIVYCDNNNYYYYYYYYNIIIIIIVNMITVRYQYYGVFNITMLGLPMVYPVHGAHVPPWHGELGGRGLKVGY